MKNPWTKKNPFMSLWLSGAHTAMNTARGHATAESRRNAGRLMREVTGQALGFWTAATAPPLAKSRSAPKRRKRR